MRQARVLGGLLFVLVWAVGVSLAGQDGLSAWWKFDEGVDKKAIHRTAEDFTFTSHRLNMSSEHPAPLPYPAGKPT